MEARKGYTQVSKFCFPERISRIKCVFMVWVNSHEVQRALRKYSYRVHLPFAQSNSLSFPIAPSLRINIVLSYEMYRWAGCALHKCSWLKALCGD